MAYDLEEQEQLASLKAWWNDHGNLVLMVVIVISLAVAGWFGWNRYQDSQSLQASVLYEQLAKGMGASDAKAVRDSAGALIENHPRSLYASMGALASAKFLFDKGELKPAKVQLEWVSTKSPSAEFRDIGRLRLAAVLMDEKAYDEAIKLLSEKHSDAFASQYAALKGDLLVAKNQVPEAKAAYKLALDKAGKQSGTFKESVQLRLDALGG